MEDQTSKTKNNQNITTSNQNTSNNGKKWGYASAAEILEKKVMIKKIHGDYQYAYNRYQRTIQLLENKFVAIYNKDINTRQG